MPSIQSAIKELEKRSLSFAGAAAGVACKGTRLEATTYGIGKKVFLFVQMRETDCVVRLKLKGSVPEAQKLAKQHPRIYSIGSQGWTKVLLTTGALPPAGLLTRWLEESHQVITSK